MISEYWKDGVPYTPFPDEAGGMLYWKDAVPYTGYEGVEENNVNVYDGVSVAETAILAFFVADINLSDAQEDILVTQSGQVLDEVVEIGAVVDFISIVEDVFLNFALLDIGRQNFIVIDEYVLVGVLNIPDDEFNIYEDILVSEDFDSLLESFLIVYEEIILSEDFAYVFVDAFPIDINVFESVSASENITAESSIQNPVYDDISVSESLFVCLDALFIFGSQDILITTHVDILDLVVEVGVVADFVSAFEEVVVALDSLNVEVNDPVAVVEAVAARPDVLWVSVEDSVAAAEWVYAYSSALNPVIFDTVAVTESLDLNLDVLNISVSIIVNQYEWIEKYLDELNIFVVDPQGGAAPFVNFLTGGTASAQDYENGNVPSNATDGNVGTYWESQQSPNMTTYWDYDLGEGIEKIPDKIRINATYVPFFGLYGKPVGEDWIELIAYDALPMSSGFHEFNTSFHIPCRYFRINVGDSTPSSNKYRINEVELGEPSGVLALDQSQSGDGFELENLLSYTFVEIGQTFTPAVSGKLERVKLCLSRNGELGGMVSVYILGVDGEGRPDWEQIFVSADFDPSLLFPVADIKTYVEFIFPSVDVVQGTKYAFVLTAGSNAVTGSGLSIYGKGDSVTVYGGGDAWINYEGGGWITQKESNELFDCDHWFETYVRVVAGAGAIGVSEWLGDYLDALNISLMADIGVVEYVAAFLPLLTLSVYDSVAVSEVMTPFMGILTISKFESVGVAEVYASYLSALFVAAVQDVLITEVVGVLDEVVEVGVVDEAVSVSEYSLVVLPLLFIEQYESVSVQEVYGVSLDVLWVDVFDAMGGLVYGSNVLTGGVATSNGTYNDFYPSYAVDGSVGTYFASSFAPPDAFAWYYDLGVGVTKVIKKIRFHSWITEGRIRYFEFYGSNNGVDYERLHFANQPDGDSFFEYEFENETAYRYYAIASNDNYVGNGFALNEIEAFELVTGGVSESIGVSLDNLNVDLYEPLAVLENILALLPELYVSRVQSVAASEFVEFDSSSRSVDVYEGFVVSEFSAVLIPLYLVDVFENITASEHIQLHDIIIEMAGADDVAVNEVVSLNIPLLFVEVYQNFLPYEILILRLTALFVDVADSVTITNEDFYVTLDSLGIIVSEDLFITEHIDIIDLMVEIGLVGEILNWSEFISVRLNALFMSREENVGVAENVVVRLPLLFMNVESGIGVVEDVSVATIVYAIPPVLDSVAVVENIGLALDVLYVSRIQNILLTESASVLDLVVEVGVVDEAIFIEEDADVFLNDLNIDDDDASDDVSVVEAASVTISLMFVDVFEVVGVSENLTMFLSAMFIVAGDDVAVAESRNVVLGALNISVLEAFLLTEVASIVDLVVEVGVLVDVVVVGESILVSLNRLNVLAEEFIVTHENVSSWPDTWYISGLFEFVFLQEVVQILDLTVDVYGIFEFSAVTENVKVSLDVLNFSVVQPMMILVTEHADIVDLIIEVGVVAEYNFVNEFVEVFFDVLNWQKFEAVTIISELIFLYMGIGVVAADMIEVAEVVTLRSVSAFSVYDGVAVEEVAMIGSGILFMAVDESVAISEYANIHDIIVELEVAESIGVVENIDMLIPECFVMVEEDIWVIEGLVLDMPLQFEAAEQYGGIMLVRVSW